METFTLSSGISLEMFRGIDRNGILVDVNGADVQKYFFMYIDMCYNYFCIALCCSLYLEGAAVNSIFKCIVIVVYSYLVGISFTT